MSRELTDQKIAALKTALQHTHLDAGQQQVLNTELTALELRLKAQLPPDAETLEGYLWEWSEQIEANHPLLMTVVKDTLQKLLAIGI
jgi:hypothetical protein